MKPRKALKSFVKWRKTRLAMLATPAVVSQEVTDRLVSEGISAIWNFAPARLTVASGVVMPSEPIPTGLSETAYHLKGWAVPFELETCDQNLDFGEIR